MTWLKTIDGDLINLSHVDIIRVVGDDVKAFFAIDESTRTVAEDVQDGKAQALVDRITYNLEYGDCLIDAASCLASVVKRA